MSDQNVFPDWRKAQLHAQAINPGRPMYQLEQKGVCACCHNIIDREKVDVGIHIKELTFLGFGIPLFYLFLQYCIVLNLLLVVTDGIIEIYRGVEFNRQKCRQLQNLNSAHLVAVKLSTASSQDGLHQYQSLRHNSLIFISNIDRNVGGAQIITQVCSFVILFIFLMYMKIGFENKGQYYNQISVDLADYAVIFKGLTKEVTGKQHIFRRLLKDFDNKKQEVYDIFVVPDSTNILTLLKQKEKYNGQYLEQREDQKEEEASLTLDKYRKTQTEIQKNVAQCIQDIKEDRVRSENVIVLFNYEEDRANFLQHDNIERVKSQLSEHFDAQCIQKVYIEQAGGPKQIIWNNLHISGTRWGRIIIGWALSLVFLFLILVAFYFLSDWKANLLVEAIEADEENNTDQTSNHLAHATEISYITFLGIVFFNKFIMSIVLHYFTHLEQHDNRATQQFSFAFKYALGMFFTTACMTLAVEAVQHDNYYKHRFGVIQEQSLMFIFSAVLIPLIWLVNPYQLVHFIKRKKYFQTQKVTQKQANHLMADFEYSIGKRYAKVIEMMWFTFLYVDIIPAGTIAILIGLCFYYWIDKSSFIHNISSSLSDKIARLIDLTIFWRSMGCVIFDYHLKGSVSTHNWILLIIAVLYCILPIKKILIYFVGEQFKVNEKRLSDVWEDQFKYDNYRSMNPLYVLFFKHPQFNEEKQMKKQAGVGTQIQLLHRGY